MVKILLPFDDSCSHEKAIVELSKQVDAYAEVIGPTVTYIDREGETNEYPANRLIVKALKNAATGLNALCDAATYEGGAELREANKHKLQGLFTALSLQPRFDEINVIEMERGQRNHTSPVQFDDITLTSTMDKGH